MKVILLACEVMRDLVRPHLDDTAADTIYLDSGLHETPKLMAPALQKELDAIGAAERVLTMAFSEFGRRLVENASQGTDHGADRVRNRN